jgi:hypothetical protein
MEKAFGKHVFEGTTLFQHSPEETEKSHDKFD